MDLVGWVNAARYKWAELTGRDIKFRPATFYLGIADYLAGEVDGVSNDEEQASGEGKGKVGDGVNVRDGVAGEEQAKNNSGEDVLFDAEEEQGGRIGGDGDLGRVDSLLTRKDHRS